MSTCIYIPWIRMKFYWAIIGVTRDVRFCRLVITFRHLIRQIHVWDTDDLFGLNPLQDSNYVHVMIGLYVGRLLYFIPLETIVAYMENHCQLKLCLPLVLMTIEQSGFFSVPRLWHGTSVLRSMIRSPKLTPELQYIINVMKPCQIKISKMC